MADIKLQRRYGVRKTEISAIGCTRQTEANRRGRWALLTNANDRVISFATGLEGQYLLLVISLLLPILHWLEEIMVDVYRV